MTLYKPAEWKCSNPECNRERRKRQRLCKFCHAEYMRKWRAERVTFAKNNTRRMVDGDGKKKSVKQKQWAVVDLKGAICVDKDEQALIFARRDEAVNVAIQWMTKRHLDVVVEPVDVR